MAGDWIKWVKGLTRRDEVVRIAMLLKRDRRYVASLCMEFWEWVDESTVDGFLPAATIEQVDIIVDSEGFGAALASVGWISRTPEGIQVTNFDRHNGESAKSRALSALRKAKQRKDTTERDKCHGDSVTQAGQMSRSQRDKSVTRGEKRREEERRQEQEEGPPTGVAAPAADELRKWAADQAKRPEWLPTGKPWITAAVWLKLGQAVKSNGSVTFTDYAAIVREARESRHTLSNPAAFIVARLKALTKGTQ